METPRIMPVETPEAVAQLRGLFLEYAESLRYHLCFDSFQAELAQLPGIYAPPAGRLLVARLGGGPVGCVALKQVEDGVCELKRLYVRPARRGSGLGRQLVGRALLEARQIGYQVVRLDTLPSMKAACALYASLGFHPLQVEGGGGSGDQPILMELRL